MLQVADVDHDTKEHELVPVKITPEPPSWSPLKEKALQAGSPTSSSSYASASTAALSPAKKKQKISCEISGVVKGAKLVVCDFLRSMLSCQASCIAFAGESCRRRVM